MLTCFDRRPATSEFVWTVGIDQLGRLKLGPNFPHLVNIVLASIVVEYDIIKVETFALDNRIRRDVDDPDVSCVVTEVVQQTDGEKEVTKVVGCESDVQTLCCCLLWAHVSCNNIGTKI